MAATEAEKAVKRYLAALHDPSSLRDEKALGAARKELEQTDDLVERLRLRQRINELESPSIEAFEDAFVEHARDWADEQGIGDQAFLDEGVPADVLRRAGFRDVRGAGRGRSRGRRKRVTSEEVRAAIPKGTTFTVKNLLERSGASPAVVRNIIREELEGGRLEATGVDRSSSGPGRAPTLYRRK